MNLTCQDMTTKELCQKLLLNFQGLHMLPYNYNNREESSIWWLTTATRNPAYSFLKFVVLPPDYGNPDEFFFGIYVEKGVGATYGREGKISQDYVLGPTWAWNSFVNETMNDPRFVKAAQDVQLTTCMPMQLRLYAHHYVKDAVRNVVPRAELLAFDVCDSLVVQTSDRPSKLLASLAGCASFAELSAALKKIPGGEYLWIDMVLGVPFKIVQDPAGTWSPDEIAEKVLKPFDYFVRQ